MNITKFKKGDIIKFINKADSEVVLNGEVVKKEGDMLFFRNTDYPTVGVCGMTSWSINNFWEIKLLSR